MKVYGTKGQPGFAVSVGAKELTCFRGRWPASGLHGLRSVRAEFDRGGDLVDLSCNSKHGSCHRWDDPALAAVVADMQCAGEARLGIEDRCVRSVKGSAEWRICFAPSRRARKA